MILGDGQRRALGWEMEKGLGYGRTRIETTENSQGRGSVTIIREGWVPTAPRGWRVNEEMTIGAHGKITRRRP